MRTYTQLTYIQRYQISTMLKSGHNRTDRVIYVQFTEYMNLL